MKNKLCYVLAFAILGLAPVYAKDSVLDFEEVFTRWMPYLKSLQNYRCEFEFERTISPNGKNFVESGKGEVISDFPRMKISTRLIAVGTSKGPSVELGYDGKIFQSTNYGGNLSLGKDISKMQARPDVDNPVFLPFAFLYFQPGSKFFSNELVSASSLPKFKDVKISQEQGRWRIQFTGENPLSTGEVKVSLELEPHNLMPRVMSVVTDSGFKSELQVKRWVQRGSFTFPAEVIRREFNPNGDVIAECRLVVTSMEPFTPEKGANEFRPPLELVREIFDTDTGTVIKPANGPAAEPAREISK